MAHLYFKLAGAVIFQPNNVRHVTDESVGRCSRVVVWVHIQAGAYLQETVTSGRIQARDKDLPFPVRTDLGPGNPGYRAFSGNETTSSHRGIFRILQWIDIQRASGFIVWLTGWYINPLETAGRVGICHAAGSEDTAGTIAALFMPRYPRHRIGGLSKDTSRVKGAAEGIDVQGGLTRFEQANRLPAESPDHCRVATVILHALADEDLRGV